MKLSLGLSFCAVFVLTASSALGNPIPTSSKKDIEPTLICPKDYKRNGSDCEKTVYEDPIVKCPAGFEPVPSASSSSSRYSAGRIRSSNRREQEKKEKKSDRNHPTPTPTECIRVIRVPPRPYCPRGYEADNAFGGDEACVKFSQEAAEAYCANGYTMRGEDEGCYRSSVHAPSLTCVDPQFTMVGRQCQRLLEMRPMEGCPEEHMLDGNSCVKVERQSPFEVCPQGSMPLNGSCLTRTVQPAEKWCPSGYTMEGENCLKADIIKSEVKCEEDAEWDGNDCVQEKILEAIQKCEEGWTLERDGFCTKVLKQRPTKFCEDGQLNPKTDQCEKMEAILPDFTCPPGYDTNDNNDCIRVVVEPVEYKCSAPRFVLKKKKCVREESSPPDQQCSDSFLLINDSCMRPTYKPKWKRCQNGFNLVADHCTAVQEMAPEMICPTGFKLKVNQCVEERRLDPQLRCSKPEMELRAGRCIRRISRPSKVDCEEPYTYNEETRMCEDKEVVEPDVDCPSGYENKGECIRVERTEPLTRCPDEHYYDEYYANCKPNKRYVPTKSVHTPPPQHHLKPTTFSPVTTSHKGSYMPVEAPSSSYYYDSAGSGPSSFHHGSHSGSGGGYEW
eukprot:GHVS01053488.1.p1 GENE.GHVS01053488.1~~GHVS01053488.1.p1  ORF type:complete len:615 (+),score=84.42 GHVS01053488.1:150-1994(+)